MYAELREIVKGNRWLYALYQKAKLAYKIFLKVYVGIYFLFSRELRESYGGISNLIDDPERYRIDKTLHERCARRAVDNFKSEIAEDIKEVYRPGMMWQNILNTVSTYSAWKKENNDAILYDALYKFYRTDLITAHSGDFYMWDVQRKGFDLKLQVYMVIKRYSEFTRDGLNINPKLITTTDVGQNLYVPYGGQKLTFKIIRHAYYLDRMIKLGLLKGSEAVVGELGCGGGELAILTQKMFPGCKYICFDLPQTLLVSSYNVMMTFPDLKVGLYEDFKNLGKITKGDIQKYDIIMLPNWCIEWLEMDSMDLFINVGSLSEMDFAIIENYLNMIERACRGHFYTVNRNISVPEWGASDIPLDRFPFSSGAEVVHKSYDTASDVFHGAYGRFYKCHYWEFAVKYRKSR